MGDDHQPTTSELKAVQDTRARAETEQAEHSSAEPEARAHERRAEKAAYLRDRLAEAERSERDAGLTG